MPQTVYLAKYAGRSVRWLAAAHALPYAFLLWAVLAFAVAGSATHAGLLTPAEGARMQRAKTGFEHAASTVLRSFRPLTGRDRTFQAPLGEAAAELRVAIRDIVSHLRADGITHTFAYGVSQAGRLLRQFLSDGLNIDESGMPVFDGVHESPAFALTYMPELVPA